MHSHVQAVKSLVLSSDVNKKILTNRTSLVPNVLHLQYLNTKYEMVNVLKRIKVNTECSGVLF